MSASTSIKQITPYEAWVVLHSMRVHFRSSKPLKKGLLWNTFTVEKFEVAPERGVARRLSRVYQTIERLSLFMASNLVMDPELWFTDLEVDMYRDRYLEARRVLSAPNYFLGNSFVEALPENSTTGLLDGLEVLNKMVSGEYTPEQVILLDRAVSFLDTIEERNFFIDKVKLRLERYRPFVTFKTAETKDNLLKTVKGKFK